MFNSLAEPNRTKSYKLEWVLFKTLECFPSALFPKIWNSIELELKETKSAKSFKRKVAKISLDSYANCICKKMCIMWINLVLTIFITQYFINMILITYVTLCSNPYAEYPPFPLYSLTSSLPFTWFIIILMFKMYNVHCFYLQYYHSFIVGQPIKTTYFWLGGSKLYSKLWFFYLYYFVLCSWIKIWNEMKWTFDI